MALIGEWGTGVGGGEILVVHRVRVVRLDCRVDGHVRRCRFDDGRRIGRVRLGRRVHGRDGRVRLDQRLLGDDRVEPVVRVRGVVHRPLGAVRVDQAVRAVNHVAVPALVLALGVARQVVVHVVRVRVRRMRVVVVVAVVLGCHGRVRPDRTVQRVRCRRVHRRAVDDRGEKRRRNC